MSLRVQPQKDVHIFRDATAIYMDPSQALFSADMEDASRVTSSGVGVDATRKHTFPPPAVPPREHLEGVRARRTDYGVGD